ncbi:hypothetical protein TNCT_61561 [Trichonephila clavata]|uniref:Uncharacterized protein n=1 Tax=Trichonephila clavata TaxID=2740835 RepID=A0A8X6HMM4_TRICU|nr:hypothetical protein TNCT_61561 [Trichonephila clavata]
MNVQNSYRLAYGDCIKQPTLRSHLHNNETRRYSLLTTRLSSPMAGCRVSQMELNVSDKVLTSLSRWTFGHSYQLWQRKGNMHYVARCYLSSLSH